MELDGVDPNVADLQGVTALHLAARFGNEEMVRYLLGQGADQFSRDFNGVTPIHLGAKGNFLKVLRPMLESDGQLSQDFDLRTYDGWTILHFSCREVDPTPRGSSIKCRHLE